LSYGRSEVAIYVATIVGVVAIDLLTGVLIGLGLSVLVLLHTFTRLRIRLQSEPDNHICRLRLQGTATFLRLPELAAALENVPAQAAVHVDCEELSYIDHACLDLLLRWETQHSASGGCLILDWDSLAARHHFRTHHHLDAVNEIARRHC
jgi:MFS superfamily sulfate permease-like transporter